MKPKDNLLWNILPRLLMIAGILTFLAGAITWENLGWRAAYISVQMGADEKAVEQAFGGLSPKPRSAVFSPGGFWNRESHSHLVIAGPNRWKYVFYFDANDRLVEKAKWWG